MQALEAKHRIENPQKIPNILAMKFIQKLAERPQEILQIIVELFYKSYISVLFVYFDNSNLIITKFIELLYVYNFKGSYFARFLHYKQNRNMQIFLLGSPFYYFLKLPYI